MGAHNPVANTEAVVVGTSHDTSESAVDAIEIWLTSYGWYHYPPGAAKWNPIEHRLFSQISLNWVDALLDYYQLILKCIRTVTTISGLAVDATLNCKRYDTGQEVAPDGSEQIDLQPHTTLPQENYTIAPQA